MILVDGFRNPEPPEILLQRLALRFMFFFRPSTLKGGVSMRSRGFIPFGGEQKFSASTQISQELSQKLLDLSVATPY